MAICPTCNQDIPDGAKFCGVCGTPALAEDLLPEEAVTAQIPEEETPVAQTPVAEAPAEEVPPAAPVFEAPAAPAKPKVSFAETLQKVTTPLLTFFRKVPKLVWILGGAGLAGLLVVILLVSLILGSKGQENYALYLKDGEIYYSDFSRDGALEVSSHLYNNKVSDYVYSSSTYTIGAGMAFNEDCTRLFFPSKTDENLSSFTLNYRDVNKPKKDSEKVDSDVISYAIDTKGKNVAYIKGNDHTLCISDLKDKEKIEKEVARFFANEDLSQLLYLTEDGELFVWSKGESERLARNVQVIEYVTDDLSTVYYLDGDTLMCLSVNDGSEEEIVDDVTSVISISEQDGKVNVYFTREEEAKYNAMDYVKDPLAASDAAIKEPEYPDYPDSPSYPYWWNYDTDEEYDQALEQYNKEYDEYLETWERLSTEYEEAYDLYYEKQDRDYLREALKSDTTTFTEEHLFCYNGTEEVVLSENVSYINLSMSNTAALIFTAYEPKSIPKFDLSEISYSGEVSSAIREALYSSTLTYLVTGATVTELEDEEASSFTIAKNGSEVYYMSNFSKDREEGDLFRISVKNDIPGEPEEIDSDVYVGYTSIRILDEDNMVYFKDADNEDQTGTLYLNGVEIDEDVYLYSMIMQEGKLLYYSDWRSKNQEGTLTLWSGKEPVEIAEDVHTFIFTPDNDVLYLADYSEKRRTGDLFLYRKGKAKEVDTDVSCLLRVYQYGFGIHGNTEAGSVYIPSAPAAEAPAAAEAVPEPRS